MIYFDNAATSGRKPETVIRAVVAALKNYNANPGRAGYGLSVKTADEVFNVRKKIADFFMADGPENVVFTPNCTQSINYVIKGVLKKGEHIIVSSLEHNALMRPLKKSGIHFSVAQVDFYDNNVTVENFKNAIKPNTRMIFCTGASNVVGKILPLKSIGEICRQKGILFAVDAAQAAGVIPINMQDMNIDFLCIAAHKGLYAPMGLGVLISRKNIEETLIEGGTGTNSLDLNQPKEFPERLESGTVNVPAIIALGAGMDYIKQIGIKRIYDGETQLCTEIYNGIKSNPNIELYTNFTYGEFAPVISFNFKGVNSQIVSGLLAENGIAVRGGFHCSPFAHKQIGTMDSGAVRISTGIFNTTYETQKFLSLINSENFLKKLKKSIE